MTPERQQPTKPHVMKTKKCVPSAKPFLGILACSMLVFCASADDWPQYLGPNRNSISPQKGILRSWPEKGPEVLWTAAVGRGYGGPVVKDGKVYLLDRDDKVGDNLRCFDLSNGKELWNFAYALMLQPIQRLTTNTNR
jgi:outer membrane protein assembly factor BamB